MSLHPTNDNIMIEIETDKYGLSGAKGQKSVQSGVVVEVPKSLYYIGFHSFAFENSWYDEKNLNSLLEDMKQQIGKRVYWTKTVDIGSTFKQGDKTLVFIKLTDIMAIDNEKDAPAALSVDTQSDMNVGLN